MQQMHLLHKYLTERTDRCCTVNSFEQTIIINNAATANVTMIISNHYSKYAQTLRG